MGRPIKVAHVVRQYYPSVGGMEDVVHNIAVQQLQRHGQLPTIVTLDRLFTQNAQTPALASRAEYQGVPIVRLPYRGSSRYPLAPAVLRELADADVVHVHGVDFFYDYLAWTKPLHRRHLVASTHGGFFHTAYASRMKKVFFNTMTRASSLAYDHVVGTSKNDGALFSQVVSAAKLSVIENGVNVEKFAGMGAAHLRPVALYFGRWSSNKGLPETIHLMAELVARDPQWQLLIAGREYDLSATDLHALIAQRGLAEHVRIVANPSEAQIGELISQASYYVCLSRHEGFGIAPIEGMSAGLIPVLSDIPPFRHLVEQSGLGILLDVKELTRAAVQIGELHAEGMQTHIARRAAAQQFVQRYSWQHIADRYVAIYQGLVAAEDRA